WLGVAGVSAARLVAVVLILGVLSVTRFLIFRDDVNNLMHVSAVSVSREVEATLAELQRDVAIFAAEHSELLTRIYQEKDIESRDYINLRNSLEKRVPNMFTFTITNEEATRVLDDFNFNVGEVCKIDIQNFVLNTYRQDIRIHPLPNGYHFDVMVPFVGNNNEVLVFFVSFIPREITRILESYANQNYEMIISSTLHPGLIEVTEHGSRDRLDKFYLAADDMVSSTVPVAGTSWEVSVLPKTGLYTNYIRTVIIDAALLFALFLLVSTPMFMIMRNQFRKRQQALVALKDSENRFFDLYESAPDIYLTITEAGDIVLANLAAREYFTEARLYASTLFALFDNKSANALKHLCADMYRSDLPEAQIELVRDGAFGPPSILQARLRLTAVVPGETRTLLVVCRDVTLQKTESRRKLEYARSQRDSLVREVHHRIKNNLQNVVSLLTSYSRKNPDLQPILQDASTKIRSIAEAYGLQSRSTKSIIYISELVSAIIENERKLFLSQINLTIDEALMGDAVLAEREITPIAVIISELITNAIKHGEKSLGASVIYVNLVCEDDSVRIEIINTLPREKLDDRDFNKLTSGQGLDLIKSLLPPKGATLTHTKKDSQMRVTLKLQAPHVIEFESDTRSTLAV
ncbi:MAG: sensor histidine kinase, partial [Gammaproteobacteria bacterium]|nr:sensor histidine kinase [Gammaproteobacteria bacterium]